MFGMIRDKPKSMYSCAVSVRVTEDDINFLKRSAELNCRTMADEVRFLIKEAQRKQA